MIDEKILIDILDSRERRAEKQKELIDKYKSTCISFTLNIPGKVKDNGVYRAIHKEGMEVIKKTLEEKGIKILYSEEEEHTTGREGYILVDENSGRVKELTMGIEESHPLGRIFDIDIFNRRKEQISRKDLEKTSRKCLLCDNDARVCMRMGSHTYESLIQNINDIWIEYINKK